MRKILAIFLAWRVFLFIPLFLGASLISYRAGYDYTNVWKFTEPYFPVSNPLLFPWANFDGVHYLSIAANGYLDNQGFFPLYPILIRILAFVLGGGEPFTLAYFASGFAISNISFILALFVFYKLVKIDFSKKIALQAIFFLLVFPTSFFFASLYTESLFLLLSLLSFYAARKKKWVFAGLLGALLSATRLTGIFILPALLYEFFLSEKKIVSAKALPLLMVPLGLSSYVFYLFLRFGNPLLFIQAHENINPTRSVYSPVLFPQTIFRYSKILTSISYTQYEWWIALLELSAFTFAVLTLYLAWRYKIRLSYIIFAGLAFIVPVSSGTFSGLPRYILILFPMFIALSLIKSPLVKLVYSAVSIILLFILLMLFSRGYFIA